ncbi:uncharacterized protein PO1_contig-115-18, partial [Mycobacterium sp. PO1]
MRPAVERRASVCGVIVLLPPSETKHPGGEGPALELDGPSCPALNPGRSDLIDRLGEPAGDRRAS